MTDVQQRNAARSFAEFWSGRGYEKGEGQQFWTSLLRDVYGIAHPESFISFEEQVKLDHTSFIDGHIRSTKVMIEQKSLGKDLRKAAAQSDGKMLTPFEQAKRYANELPNSQRPRWIVVCNFQEFLVYDLEHPHDDPLSVLLENLDKDYHLLNFLVEETDEKIIREKELSIEAGRLVGRLYDMLLAQYADPTSPDTLRSLNILCVRLVFCMYAEDASLFGKKNMFVNYLRKHSNTVRSALKELFKVLDTKESMRDPYLDEDLAAFPYVHGDLFSDEDIEIPRFTPEIITLIEKDCSADFDWSGISPTIFGAVFESTLNPETRRSGGMHYTSVENIHKLIDPLFLDDLKKELEDALAIPVRSKREKTLKELQDKLASLTFLDPACGSGNFLTETFLSLRKLENEIIRVLRNGDGPQLNMGAEFSPIKVNIKQFYGIEINDFAVTVARTALWISEAQMQKNTEDIIAEPLSYFPLESYQNIIEGNALHIDWNDVVPATRLNYIMGNPPFVGARWMGKEQKDDVLEIFGAKWPGVGDLDYVCCWYKKATDYIKDTHIRCALVSTNSITQGGAVANLWKPLMEDYGVHIDFAWRTFRWDSEASIKAQVHCVIVGFSLCPSTKQKIIFSSVESAKVASTINGYLLDAPNIFIEKRMKPISDVPEICLGGQPIDDGNLTLTEEEKDTLLKKEAQAEPCLRFYMMGKDFIDRKPRYCLWLKGIDPSIIRKCPEVLRRIENVRTFRLASNRTSTIKAAENPMLFGAPFECSSDYVAIPKVSSENRHYIPMDYLSKDIIPGDKLFTMQEASLYHFGIMESNVHMAWMRAICGRLKSDYSYSNTIVYNNFPWPTPSEEQKAKIEQTAQAILDARALYPDSSLADLYDELTMPIELRKAHQANDAAVMAAYGFPKTFTESDIVAALMKMYKDLTDK